MVFFFRKTIIFQGSRGGLTFSRGGGGRGSNFVQVGAVQMLISIKTYRNLGFSRQGVRLSPLWTRACSAFICSSDPVIDLHMLFVSELGGTGRFHKPHRCHSVVSLSKTHLSFNPESPVQT